MITKIVVFAVAVTDNTRGVGDAFNGVAVAAIAADVNSFLNLAVAVQLIIAVAVVVATTATAVRSKLIVIVHKQLYEAHAQHTDESETEVGCCCTHDINQRWKTEDNHDVQQPS